jgi:hypothetical protein
MMAPTFSFITRLSPAMGIVPCRKETPSSSKSFRDPRDRRQQTSQNRVAKAVSNYPAGRKRPPAGNFYLQQALNYIDAALFECCRDLDYAGPFLRTQATSRLHRKLTHGNFKRLFSECLENITRRCRRCRTALYDYGRGTVSPASRLPHCTLVAFAMPAPPVINDLESQNRSVPFPLIWVKGFAPVTATEDRLATTKPP